MAYREATRCAKQNRWSNGYRFKGSVRRSASERVGAFRYEGRTRHSAARRITGWAILPQVFGTRQVKPRRIRTRLLRRPRRVMTTSDGDVSRFTTRGPRFNGVLWLAAWFMIEQTYAMNDPTREDNRCGAQDLSYRKSPSNIFLWRGGIIVDKRRASMMVRD